MSLFGTLLAGLFGRTPTAPPISAAETERQAEWQEALAKNRLPPFVKARLAAAAGGRAPWLATIGPAELALVRSRGIRPLGMVCGTCWYHYGQSWTRGHVTGWHQALARLKAEAVELGANAVVDVAMRTIGVGLGDDNDFADGTDFSDGMDFTLVGTAVRVDALPPGKDPVVATVSALEFLRLLEAGIVPVGIAIGAYDGALRGDRLTNAQTRGGVSGSSAFRCYPATRVGGFWEGLRRRAVNELKNDALRQGNGVLAHTHFALLAHREGTDENSDPPRFIGRHLVIGTVVEAPRADAGTPHQIRTVVDLRDDGSPLTGAASSRHNAYPVWEEEGAI